MNWLKKTWANIKLQFAVWTNNADWCYQIMSDACRDAYSDTYNGFPRSAQEDKSWFKLISADLLNAALFIIGSVTDTQETTLVQLIAQDNTLSESQHVEDDYDIDTPHSKLCRTLMTHDIKLPSVMSIPLLEQTVEKRNEGCNLLNVESIITLIENNSHDDTFMSALKEQVQALMNQDDIKHLIRLLRHQNFTLDLNTIQDDQYDSLGERVLAFATSVLDIDLVTLLIEKDIGIYGEQGKKTLEVLHTTGAYLWNRNRAPTSNNSRSIARRLLEEKGISLEEGTDQEKHHDTPVLSVTAKRPSKQHNSSAHSSTFFRARVDTHSSSAASTQQTTDDSSNTDHAVPNPGSTS